MRQSETSGQIIYSPTDLITFFRSPYVSWLEHFNLVSPKAKQIHPTEDETLELLKRKGNEFEQKIFKEMFGSKKSAQIKRSPSFEISQSETLSAMAAGAEVVYQAALSCGEFQGYADFLKKVPGRKSKLGNFSYEVYDTKLARSPKPEYAVQINCYNEMLFNILGHWPEKWHLILGNGVTEAFPTSDYRYYYEHFKAAFLRFHKSFEVNKSPFPEPWEDVSGYEDHVEELFKKVDHLCLIAGMSGSQIRKFNSLGVKTRASLAKASEKSKPVGMRSEVFEKLREQAALQIESEQTGELAFRILQHAKDEHVGLARLPKPSAGDVIFDMEGDPLADDGHEYLFGVLVEEKSKWVYRDWRAIDHDEEKDAFCEFMKWLIARYHKFPDMHVYHYASYEESAISKLSNKHSCKVSEVDVLLKNDVFVDLYKVVKEGVRVGSESYSIKKLEPLYGYKRKSLVTNAGDSVAQFHKFCDLRTADPKSADDLFQEIVDYNREDVESTLDLLEWLRNQQSKSKIRFVPSPIDRADLDDPKDWEEIAESLIESPPKWIKTQEQERVNRVVAGISGYFHREDRPVWWAYYYREDSLPEELFMDAECLALAVVERVSGSIARLSFDPDQPIKLKEGAKMCVHGFKKPFYQVTVRKLDLVKGTAEVDGLISPKLRDEVTLIPGGPLRTERQKEILLDAATDWKSRGEKALTSAICDLLYRKPPRVKGYKQGSELYSEKEKALDAALRIALNLDSSCLSIQGPPGTGKTFTGAHIICHLLKAGKRVGVVAQGKKTIGHILSHVVDRWKELKFKGECPAILMADGDLGGDTPNPNFKYVDNTTARKLHSRYQLVGGTHWVFAHPDMANQPFDYLFFDEAGQFALGAAVACSYSTRNLVLLGDQMQLEQVNTGAHPDDSGLSILNYYMNGERTIPRTKGVFLDETWRMHPKICDFVSELVYESRLQANKRTDNHRLKVPKAISDLVRSSGILFLEVEHEGNAMRSEEEVAKIEELISELKKTSVPDEDGNFRRFEISDEDLIVITPYNAQVELIRTRLPEVKVGSVDLFQGQEAWISVLSMCASGEEGLHRGLDFLLSKNRMNVGLSRAKALTVVVGSPRLLDIRPTRISTIPLLNLYAALKAVGTSSISEAV